MKRFGSCSGKKHIVVGLGVVLMAVVLQFFCGTTAYADNSGDHGFSIEAELLPGNAGKTYDISLLVSGSKTDLEGTVRLFMKGAYSKDSCAYDTAITLPKGSEKQFTVRIPEQCLLAGHNEIPEVCVQVLDHKGKVLAEETFKHLLEDERSSLLLGILSDQYSKLTYLDLGGDAFYFHGGNYPIKLAELDAKNLQDRLSGLSFLVIDRFDSGSLSDAQRIEIDDWVNKGGVLIIGTGDHVEKTLNGWEDYLGIEYRGTIWEGIEDYSEDEDAWFSTQMYYTKAELDDVYGEYRYDTGLDLYTASRGSGAVAVVPYSLAEVWEKGYSPEASAEQILNEAANMSSGYYQSNYNTDFFQYRGKNLMSILNNSVNRLHFTALILIVFFYVILVGPVLYLVLKLTKKRESYWLAVPAAALLFVLIISFAGRGFEVKEARVLSVSVARADGREEKRTFIQCYNAGHREWTLKMDDAYDCASPSLAFSYYYGEEGDSYKYHVVKDGKGLSIGANPSENFEDLFYYALGKNEDSGSIDVSDMDIKSAFWKQGTIANHTDYDFEYVAVAEDDSVLIYGRLASGDSMDLNEEEPIYTISAVFAKDDLGHRFLYDVLYDVYSGSKRDLEASRRLSALGMGASILYSEEPHFVMGLAEDYDKVVDDKCAETSYGCLYTTLY